MNKGNIVSLFIFLIHIFFFSYKVPGEKTFRTSIIPDLAIQARKKMEEKIAAARASETAFSFTTDIWTSRANDSYISLTVHFLIGFERQNLTLNVSAFNVQHTAANIASKMETLLRSWGFEEKDVFMILRDNAANMRAAFRDGGFDSFGCLAHTFQVGNLERVRVRVWV